MTGLKIAHRQRFEQVAEALGGGAIGGLQRENRRLPRSLR